MIPLREGDPVAACLIRAILPAVLAASVLGCTTKKSDKESRADSEVVADSGPPIDPVIAEYLENGFVDISPGTFVVGAPEGEPCRGMYTEDQVEVTLTYPFEIAETEVTQAVWEAAGFPNPSHPNQADDLPVNYVNWFEAALFCNRLSEAAGLETCYDLSPCTGEPGAGCSPEDMEPRRQCVVDVYWCLEPIRKRKLMYNCSGYRLPTAAEWEYAARAGTTASTYNGNSEFEEECGPSEVLDPIAWYCHNADDQPNPVGKRRPNPWGLYDVIGNLGEWTEGVYGGASLETYEGMEGPLTDPIGPPESISSSRSAMGGPYIFTACNLRVSRHLGWSVESRSNFIGLRPVRTLDPPDPGPEADTDSGTGEDPDTETEPLDRDTGWNTDPRPHEPMVPCEGGAMDPETGLCWQVPRAEEKMVWLDAIDYCDSLELAGFDDWYLADIEELSTLIRGCAVNEPGGVCAASVDVSCYDWCHDDAVIFSCAVGEGPGPNGCYWDEAMGECPLPEFNNDFVASSECIGISGDPIGHSVRFFDAIPGANGNPNFVMCVRRTSGSE